MSGWRAYPAMQKGATQGTVDSYKNDQAQHVRPSQLRHRSANVSCSNHDRGCVLGGRGPSHRGHVWVCCDLQPQQRPWLPRRCVGGTLRGRGFRTHHVVRVGPWAALLAPCRGSRQLELSSPAAVPGTTPTSRRSGYSVRVVSEPGWRSHRRVEQRESATDGGYLGWSDQHRRY
jgi:hypothetical protein